jgi:hypothetical protein
MLFIHGDTALVHHSLEIIRYSFVPVDELRIPVLANLFAIHKQQLVKFIVEILIDVLF